MKKIILSLFFGLLLLCLLLPSCTGANIFNAGITSNQNIDRIFTSRVSDTPAKLRINDIDIFDFSVMDTKSEFQSALSGDLADGITISVGDGHVVLLDFITDFFSDELTVLAGEENTAQLDFTTDFFEGVVGSGTGNATSVSWSEMS